MIITLIIAILGGWLFGLWLNKQAYDELKAGKKWFAAIMWTAAIAGILCIIFFRNLQGFDSLLGALVFLMVLAYTSYRKGK